MAPPPVVKPKTSSKPPASPYPKDWQTAAAGAKSASAAPMSGTAAAVAPPPTTPSLPVGFDPGEDTSMKDTESSKPIPDRYKQGADVWALAEDISSDEEPHDASPTFTYTSEFGDKVWPELNAARLSVENISSLLRDPTVGLKVRLTRQPLAVRSVINALAAALRLSLHECNTFLGLPLNLEDRSGAIELMTAHAEIKNLKADNSKFIGIESRCTELTRENATLSGELKLVRQKLASSAVASAVSATAPASVPLPPRPANPRDPRRPGAASSGPRRTLAGQPLGFRREAPLPSLSEIHKDTPIPVRTAGLSPEKSVPKRSFASVAAPSRPASPPPAPKKSKVSHAPGSRMSTGGKHPPRPFLLAPETITAALLERAAGIAKILPGMDLESILTLGSKMRPIDLDLPVDLQAIRAPTRQEKMKKSLSAACVSRSATATREVIIITPLGSVQPGDLLRVGQSCNSVLKANLTTVNLVNSVLHRPDGSLLVQFLERPTEEEYNCLRDHLKECLPAGLGESATLDFVTYITHLIIGACPCLDSDGKDLQFEHLYHEILKNPKWGGDHVLLPHSMTPRPLWIQRTKGSTTAGLVVAIHDTKSGSVAKSLIKDKARIFGNYLTVAMYRPKEYVPQCRGCYNWGHTTGLCRALRKFCPRCGGTHEERVHDALGDCCKRDLKGRVEGKCTHTPTCCNCKGAHTAYSRECIFYKHRDRPEWFPENRPNTFVKGKKRVTHVSETSDEELVAPRKKGKGWAASVHFNESELEVQRGESSGPDGGFMISAEVSEHEPAHEEAEEVPNEDEEMYAVPDAPAAPVSNVDRDDDLAHFLE